MKGKRFTKLIIISLFILTPAIGIGIDYPTKTITMICPYPPGGVTDLGARALAESMEKHLKQPVVVVNKVGGGTTVGGYAVASSKPDGYTLGFFPTSAMIPEAYAYFQEAPYTSNDLKFVSGVVGPVLSVAVKEDAPWKSFEELIEYAKKNPGIKVGTGGKQTVQYMFLTILNKTKNTGFVPIPFTGDPQNLSSLLGGHTLVGIMDYSAVSSLIEAKRVRVLAVLIERRVEFAPNIPTVVELGYSIVYIPILGVVGPKKMPEEIVSYLDSLIGKICKEQPFQIRMRNIPLQIIYQNSTTFEQTNMKYKKDIMSYFKEEGLIK
jgi:tripartite-type tricarboxylate transporter receptor subunit TctC